MAGTANPTDIGFVFDPSPVINGAKNAGKAMEGVGQGAMKAGAIMNQTFTQIVAKIGATALVLKGYRAMLDHMPEVGQVLSAGADVFWRNFVQPLRQEVLPYLRQFAHWVTANRANFVLWGSVVANIFRAVVGAISIVVDVLKRMFEKVKSVLESVFGKQTQTIVQMLNLVILKIAFLFAFLMDVLDPIFDAIAHLVGFIIVGIKGLWDGLVKGLFDSGFFEAMHEVAQTIKDFFEYLLGGSEEAQGFYKIMKAIGYVVGVVLGAAMKALAISLKILFGIFIGMAKIGKFFVDVVMAIVNAVKEFFSVLSNGGSISDAFMAGFSSLGASLKSIFTNIWEGLKRGLSVVVDFIFEKLEKVKTFLLGLWDSIKGIFSKSDEAAKKISDLQNQKSTPAIQASNVTNKNATQTTTIHQTNTYSITGKNANEIADKVNQNTNSNNNTLRNQLNRNREAVAQ